MGSVECKTELCRNHNPVAVRPQRFSEQFLVFVRICIGAVNFGGVKQCISHFYGIGKKVFHCLPVCRRTIGVAHAHTSEADRRYCQAPKFSFHHYLYLIILVVLSPDFTTYTP